MNQHQEKLKKISELIGKDSKIEESKDLMSNLKRLESMMKKFSQGKQKNGQERLKEIQNLKASDEDLSEVCQFSRGGGRFL